MYKIRTYNQISDIGLSRFPMESYEVGPDVAEPDAFVLRSQKLHDEPVPQGVLAVARAGAGVNNIPVDDYTHRGIVVFNTPGANANAVKELVTAARNYYQDEEEEMDPLSAFLAHAALEAGEGQAEAWEDCVQLMSLHSAKGLEFPLVFLTGLEEGLFPSQHALNDPSRLEEERRLCYVGMTRAMKQLYISYAEVRRLYGRENYTTPSRFLQEIPAETIEEIRTRNGAYQTPWQSTQGFENSSTASENGLSLGSGVLHDKFGEGIIMNIEGKGEHTRVQVNFESAGIKWLVLSFARLTSL